MFFVIKSSNTTADLTIYRTKKQARMAIQLIQMGVTELQLERYIRTKFSLNFKEACIKIVNNMTFHLNMQGEIIVKIPNKELNTLARIITYGTGSIPGSQVLRTVLTLC